MDEHWIKWEPLQGLGKKYCLRSIVDNFHQGFKIRLYDYETNTKVEVRFKTGVQAYRYTNESYRLNLWGELSSKYGDGILSWTFFKVTNSRYQHWVEQEETLGAVSPG